jgi:riboflavin kinase/FMN adenylyltransferase
VVGDHFRYGKNRSGDINDLNAAGSDHGFEVRGVADVEIDGATVSSTLIRRALSSGNLDFGSKLLGRHYRMSGEVVHGNHLGRKLGFPTANIEPDRLQVALAGIFAVRVSGLGDAVLDGVASLGTRPTVGGTRMLLEVHIFDFDEDIYGCDLQVAFVEKIRDELNFPDVDALIEYMHKDVSDAKRILAG